MTYEERVALIRKAFHNAPLTQVPGLTVNALELAIGYRTAVWQRNGVSTLASRIEAEHISPPAKAKPRGARHRG